MAATFLVIFIISVLSLYSFSHPTYGELHCHGPDFPLDYVLHVQAKNIIIGCEQRFSVTINGTSPGPELYLQEGRTKWIRVVNNMLEQNVAMHWHGLSQRTAPFSDGSPQASQWPIAPGEFFDYELRPEFGDAGTYFYHSHVGFQAITAYGALIVENCGPPPFKYADDIIITLADYVNRTDTVIENDVLGVPFKPPGGVNALLFNGGSGTCGVGSDPSCAPYVIHVNPNTVYRLRFIGATVESLVTLCIEGHENLTIIEADGFTTKPFSVRHLQVASGQTFSLLLHTKTLHELHLEKRSKYWIQYENRGRTPPIIFGYAILSYNVPEFDATFLTNLPIIPPVSLPQRVTNWLEYSLEPNNLNLRPFPKCSEVTRTVLIDIDLLIRNRGLTFEWALDNDVWKPTVITTPYLVSIYEQGEAAIPDYNAALANGGWDPATLAFPAKLGEVIDIIWQANNTAAATGGAENWHHPLHTHGGHYWDLGGGEGVYNASVNEMRFERYTPAMRTTTVLYSYVTLESHGPVLGWRAWRVKVDDPGVWMMHCHILMHAIMGMQTAWVFGNVSQITGKLPEPYVAGYLEYGGNAYGNASYDPFVNHYFAEGGSKGCKGMQALGKGVVVPANEDGTVDCTGVSDVKTEQIW